MSLASADFDFLSRLIREQVSIVVEPGKQYLLENRLLPLARELGKSTLSEFAAHLMAHSDDRALLEQVAEAMTTNETSFFRDQQPFDLLRTTILPELIEKRSKTRSLNIWSAACSSGQETYSLAILLHEHFPHLANWNVRIIATDYSPKMLSKAIKGNYSRFDVERGVTAEILAKYFKQNDSHWTVNSMLRKNLEFRQLNLTKPWPLMPKFDVVFLRNVLIYFDVPTKRKVTQQVHKVIHPDGYLFLGAAETLHGLDDSFCRQQFSQSSCYRPKTT